MPSMTKIYESHSIEYDEMVRFEDYQGNLRKYIQTKLDIKDKTIIEMGAGTGKVTKLLIPQAESIHLFDRSEHMLDLARKNLEEFNTKLSYSVCDNIDVGTISIKADLLIEGWSFGHTAVQNFDKIEAAIEKLISGCIDVLNPEGQIVIIETLGTNCEYAHPPTEKLSKFYTLLEEKYNFTKEIIRTDFKFDTNEKAKELLGFFFGEELKSELVFHEEGVVKEFTGVWRKQK